MGWFSQTDKIRHRKFNAAMKRRSKRNQEKIANSLGMGITMVTNPVLGIGMMAIGSALKKRKKRHR